MKTTRSRMLIVFTAAAIIISLFSNWDSLARGWQEGYNDGVQHRAR
jgi:hypothetical protein